MYPDPSITRLLTILDLYESLVCDRKKRLPAPCRRVLSHPILMRLALRDALLNESPKLNNFCQTSMLRSVCERLNIDPKPMAIRRWISTGER